MNRFSSTRKLHRPSSFSLSLLLFFLLLLLFWQGISYVGRSTTQKQEESLRTALERSVSQCYALEGIYPPSLSYLEEHYGLTYDKELFFVDYQAIGSNLLPDITIIRKQGGAYDF